MKRLLIIFGVLVLVTGILVIGYLLAVLPIDMGHEPENDLYINPEPVEISGYRRNAMEPFISPDGRHLFFNNDYDGTVDTNLYRAERTGKLSFRFMGEVPGVHSDKLDAAVSIDVAGHFFFTTLREYDRTLKSVFAGNFDGEHATDVHPVEGDISPGAHGTINMDMSISPDGETLYISRARFSGLLSLIFKSPVESHLLVARREGVHFSLDPASAEIMKNVTTGTLEYAPAISANGLELYFTRASVPKGMRIMVATRGDLCDLGVLCGSKSVTLGHYPKFGFLPEQCRLPRRFAPRNDDLAGLCHCERSEAISLLPNFARTSDGHQ